MRTTINIDDALLQQAMVLTGQHTKTATVDVALRQLVQARQRQALCDLIGNYDEFDLSLADLETMRSSRPCT